MRNKTDGRDDRMIQIIPTLFATSEEEYRIRLARLKSSSFSEDGWVQLDLMDNKFVPKLGISIDVVRKYPNPYHKEAQLMVLDPGEWIDGLVKLPIDRIIFPVEIDEHSSSTSKDIFGFINLIKENQIEVGLSLNPESEINLLDSYLNLVDSILLMGVKPGFEKQLLDPGTYEKIRVIKQKASSIKVGVDGGVNNINIKKLVQAGVDYVAIGSFLFTGDFDENLEILWEAIND